MRLIMKTDLSVNIKWHLRVI